MSVLAAVDISAVETRQIASVEPRQRSAVKARHMSAALPLQEQSYVLSQHTMVMSQKSELWQCRNVEVADRRSGSKSAKMVPNGSRMVARA